MVNKTPPLHATGVYKLAEPFAAPANVLYECIAIRSFRDFVDRGEDVFAKYYETNGLDRDAYERDRNSDTKIITLQSKTAPIIHVPDSYIESFPDLTGVSYKRIVLSVLLGPLPDTLDLTHLKTSMAALASDITGVDADVNEHVAPYSGAVSADQHVVLEQARQAAITNRTTERATVLRQQAIIDAQAEQLRVLQQWLRDNGHLD